MEQSENTAVQDEINESEDLQMEEITEEPADESLSLEEALGEDGSPEKETEPQGTGGTEKTGETQQEPGYVRRRIEKALAQQREAFEAEMAPMREYMLNMQAQELVRSGKVKDLETAKELVRYRQGRPQPAQQAGQEQQPRNERGQFTQKQEEVNPATKARVDMLQHQADRIKAQGGPDVIAEFKSNEEVRKKLVTGEMDFYDVAEQMKKARKKTPSPMRSPNGASGNSGMVNFDTMSSEQFARLEKKLEEGVRISYK